MTIRQFISLLLPGILVFTAISTWPAPLLPEVIFVYSFTSARLFRWLATLRKWSFRAPAHSPSILVILSWFYAPMSWSIPRLVPMSPTWSRPLSLVVLPWNLLDWRWSLVITLPSATTIGHCICWGALAIIVVLRWVSSHLRRLFLFRWISLCAMQFTSSLTLANPFSCAWSRRWPATTLSSLPSTNRRVFSLWLCEGKLLPSCFLFQW